MSEDYYKWKESQNKYEKTNTPINVVNKDIPQSEINLGLHKFGEQHRTGNHLIIIGIIATTIGGLLISDSYKYPNTSNSFPPGVVFSVAGGGLTTAGLIVNLNSFRYLR